MKDARGKEKLYNSLREALLERSETLTDTSGADATGLMPDANGDDISIVLAQNFIQRGGTMFYCYNEGDISAKMKEIQHLHGDVVIGCGSENLTQFLSHLGVTNSETASTTKRYPLCAMLCESLTAWNGGIVVSSNQGLGVTLPTLGDATIVLAFTSQVVADWAAAAERMRQMYSEMPEQLLVTNPASASFRQGRQRLYLILIEDEE